MRAQIISIGDELLIGQVINTNAAFIANKLGAVGITVVRTLTVGDDEREILDAFASAYAAFDVVLVTGGLGPTHDDITRKVVCDFFSTNLVPDHSVLEHIKSLFLRRNIPLNKLTEDQALVPRGAKVIHNPLGTAPGILFDRDGKFFIVMPGVPYEMERMIDDFVAPLLKDRSGTTIIHRTLKTTGITESALATRLGDINTIIGDAKLAFLPSPFGVRLRISVIDSDRSVADKKTQDIEARIREQAGKYIYATDEEDIEDILGKLLLEKKLTIAVAESVTGGLIANRLTNVGGSSAYFLYGVTAYSNESKTNILGVDPTLIRQHGAVSREVAETMAEGVRKIGRSSIGLSTTGIAGPTGGTPEKPVGLVWIGYATEAETNALKFNFAEGRIRIKERASQAALDLIRRKILKLE